MRAPLRFSLASSLLGAFALTVAAPLPAQTEPSGKRTVTHEDVWLMRRLGTPALSTSDVQLMRSLATSLGLESARVTNGFYTYTVEAADLDRLRSR